MPTRSPERMRREARDVLKLLDNDPEATSVGRALARSLAEDVLILISKVDTTQADLTQWKESYRRLYDRFNPDR